MRMRRLTAAGLVLLASGWAVAAGELAIPGTGDGMEILKALGAAYTAGNPETVITIPPSTGSGGGKIAVAQGKVVLGRIAVPLTASEEAAGLVSMPVFKVPTAIFVHPSAQVDRITAEQLAKLFTGEITNWQELGGADLRVRIVRREEADSTLQVLRASMPGWKDLAITERSKLAYTTQEAIETVRTVKGAIGWGPYSNLLEDGLTIVSLDGKHPLDPNYPSSTRIRLIYSKTNLPEEAKRFLRFAGSPEARRLYGSFGGVPEAADAAE